MAGSYPLGLGRVAVDGCSVMDGLRIQKAFALEADLPRSTARRWLVRLVEAGLLREMIPGGGRRSPILGSPRLFRVLGPGHFRTPRDWTPPNHAAERAT